MDKDHILASLPALTRPELEQIHAVAETLLGGRIGNVAAPVSALAASLIEAISGALNAPLSPLSLAGTTIGKTLDRHCATIQKFLDAHFDGWDLTKLAQAAFLSLLMELLRDDLRRCGTVPTIGIMVKNLLRLPEVFDHAYPGYLEAGMGHVILNHFKKVQVPPPAQLARKKSRRISV